MRKLDLKTDMSFYEVLRVLYKFIDDESRADTGEVLKKMNQTKKNIVDLCVDLGNLALLDGWYDRKKIGNLPELVDFNDDTGYSSRSNIGSTD